MPSIENIPQELIQKLVDDRCVAFIGAGLSAGAGLPLWDKLLIQMIEWSVSHHIPLPDIAELHRLIEEKDFLTVADVVTEEMGDGRFREFMTTTFRRPDLLPTELHKLLPQIPFASILTSNYDKLIESAYTTALNGASVPVFTPLDNPELAGTLQKSEFHILKTHGTIDRINSIVLSRRQYHQLMHANQAYKIYMQQILLSKSILFLGFSLTDPDLLLILDELRVCFRDDTPPHFALMDKMRLSPIKAERFRRDYNFNIIEYLPSSDSHPEVTEFLQQLINRTPKKFLRNLDNAKKELDNLDSHYKLVATTENEFIIKEKFPGAAEEKPLQTGFTLIFDAKTEESRAAKEAWENFVKTGETTTISSPNVQNSTLPDFLSKLINFVPESVTMTIGTYQSGEKFRVRLVATADDGTAATIDNIELEKISQGEESITLDNDKQNYFFLVRFVWELKNNTVNVSFKYNDENITIFQALIAERFLSVLAKGGRLTIESMESGMPLGGAVFPSGKITGADPLFIQVLEALMMIQQKLGVKFDVPKTLALAEAKNILEAAQLIRTGKGEGTLNAEIEVDREAAKRMLEDNGSFSIQHYAESVYVIQGQKIFLGSVWTDAENLILSDGEKNRLREEIDENADQQLFVIQVTNSPDTPTVIYYLNFLAENEFERLHRVPRFRTFTLNNILNLLFDAAEDEDGTVVFSALTSTLEEAAKQITDSGEPFNMLKRATADELGAALKPLLPRLSAKKAKDFIAELVKLSIIAENEISKMDVSFYWTK